MEEKSIFQKIGDVFADYAPGLSKVLAVTGVGIPAAAGVAALGSIAKAFGLGSDAKPEEILDAVSADPEIKLKAMIAENNFKLHMREIEFQEFKTATEATTAQLQTVNATMQAELANSDKEAWYQKAWRPANGFAVAAGSLTSVWFVCYLFYKVLVTVSLAAAVSTILNVLPQLAIAISTLLAIPGAAVGIAAWHRGQQKREEEKAQTN
ncbi:MAG: 3TM-type holin [Deltaproteobacteria bacterium]|nr:3TM-type holin [Deltaproteobacteria bacterium]